MLAESEANLRSGADAMQVAQDLAQDLFHTRMKEFIEQYEGLLAVGEANRATIQEQKETIKDLQTQVLKYQSEYHDISLGDLHQKITYLETMNDQYSRTNVILTGQIKQLNRNMDNLKDDLIFYKEKALMGVHNKNPWGYEQKYNEEKNWQVSLTNSGLLSSVIRPKAPAPQASSSEESLKLDDTEEVLQGDARFKVA